MAVKSGRRLLYFAGDACTDIVEKSAEMVLLSAVGDRICAVVLSDIAGDGDQSYSREIAKYWNGGFDGGDRRNRCCDGRK